MTWSSFKASRSWWKWNGKMLQVASGRSACAAAKSWSQFLWGDRSCPGGVWKFAKSLFLANRRFHLVKTSSTSTQLSLTTNMDIMCFHVWIVWRSGGVYRSIVASATSSSLIRSWPFKYASQDDLRAQLRKMEASASDHDTEQAPFLLVRVRWIVEWLDLLILFSPGGSSGATAEDGSKCFQSRDGKGHYLMCEDVLLILLL